MHGGDSGVDPADDTDEPLLAAAMSHNSPSVVDMERSPTSQYPPIPRVALVMQRVRF